VAKKLSGAMVASFIVLVATSYFIHGVWLRHDYELAAAAFRPLAALRHRIWLTDIGEAIFTVLFCYVYSRGVEPKPWWAQGIRYGILMTFLIVVPASLSQYVAFNIPHQLALKWMAAGLVQLILLGLITAAFVGRGKTAG
jgi:hypothetical protein